MAGVDTGVRIAATTSCRRCSRWRSASLDVRGQCLAGQANSPTSPPLLDGLTATARAGTTWPPVARPPVGWIQQDDGRVTLGAAVPLGVLQARVAEYLAAIEAPMVITPWRSVLVCDLDEGVADAALRVLAPLGLVFDDGVAVARRQRVHRQPGLRALAGRRPPRRRGGRARRHRPASHRHFVGCERACGSPPVGEVLVATADGYEPRHP